MGWPRFGWMGPAAWRKPHSGLFSIGAEIIGAAAVVAEETPAPTDWQGLEGWLWVTRVLEEVLECFSSKNLANE
jgi:hypothetical protein